MILVSSQIKFITQKDYQSEIFSSEKEIIGKVICDDMWN